MAKAALDSSVARADTAVTVATLEVTVEVLEVKAGLGAKVVQAARVARGSSVAKAAPGVTLVGREARAVREGNSAASSHRRQAARAIRTSATVAATTASA